MNTKKLLLATIVSFVVMFALGGLIHLVLLKDWYLAHAGMAGDQSRAQPMMQFISLGVLVLAFSMSYMYPKGVESSNIVMEGLKFGVIIGILWVIPHDLILYGA